jgi:hypothetical protein
MMPMSDSITPLRRGVGTETRRVDAEAYCRLLTSRQRLERFDDHARGCRGLVDPETRIHYLIDERQLYASGEER